ncbi:Glycosyl transferase, group 2 family [Candidatus Scalindua japonica]|uniref:Glycosyl transferase, group 2 family n=1 Tax=Candidatus Scalindua japonica TaxID=1284222 RepID=A0A286TWV0_9BACT|nr:sulfotransferase domain-containing protein [Candidatus Scalindua japonica]GAX60366.1 Glycosyl transferase, group 2 family [Candidatus Scalindua japonica]
MKTVYLHIGLHKTGTTAIQWFLFSIMNLLKEDASAFYETKSVGLVNEIYRKVHGSESDLDAILNEISMKYNNLHERTIIISNEELSGTTRTGYKDSGLLANVIKYIFRDFNVKICVFVRRQDTFLESFYVHGLKVGLYQHSFHEYLNRIDRYAFNWYTLLEKYEQLFGYENMTVIPYEELAKDNTKVIKHFFESINVNITTKNIKLPYARPGLSEKGLEIVKRCHPILNNEEKELLRFFLEDKFPRPIDKPNEYLTVCEREDILNYYKESNTEMFNKFISRYGPEIYYG